MNKNMYKVIFSQHLGQLVVVGEDANRSGKCATGERGAQASAAPEAASEAATRAVPAFLLGLNSAWRNMLAAGLLCVGGVAGFAHASGLAVNALPTGAAVQAGSVSHTTTGNTMNIVQTTGRAVVNHSSFDIGRDATVNHSGGVMLARVIGEGATRIEGTLNSSGMVLVNGNGIAIGSGATINAGRFTASTLNITDDNFMSGNMVFERTGAGGTVTNQGQITVTEGGGYVALIGATVSQEGTITTAGGDVTLAAADKVSFSQPSVNVPLSSRVSLQLDPAALSEATVSNSGVIVTDGGQVLLRAAAVVDAVSGMARAQVTHSGTIDTSATTTTTTTNTTNTTETIAAKKGGRVDVLADKGIVRVSGTVKANSTSGTAGAGIYIGRDEATNVLAAVGDASGAQLESQGGFVETSGDYLITAGTRVKAQDWLLDPFDIVIVAAGTTAGGASLITSAVANADINAALDANTNVTISTDGAGGDDGNITVNADIVKTTTGTASLTLIADNNITVNKRIEAVHEEGGINVTLRARETNDAGRILLANVNPSTRGIIVAKKGSVVLQTQGGSIRNAANATISGVNVTIDNTGGSVINGVYVAGDKKTVSGVAAVTIGANITATSNLIMFGSATNHNGIAVGGGVELSGGNIQATGQTGAGGHVFNSYGFFVFSGGQIRTTGAGDSVVKGIRLSSANVGQGAFQTQAATFTAAADSSLTIEGHAIGTGLASHPNNTRGIRIDGAVNTVGDIKLKGTSVGNEGVLVFAPVSVISGSLSVDGTMTASGGGWRSGVAISQNITLSEGTTLTVVGRANNTGATLPEWGVNLGGKILQALDINGIDEEAGDVSITGTTTSGANSEGVLLNGSITTAGKITVVGQTLGDSRGAAVQSNALLTSDSNDITIQSIGGRIQQTADSTFTAKNITIDNTGAGLSRLIADTIAGLNLSVGTAMGGSIDAATGAITAGSGTYAATNEGNISDNALNLAGTLEASGNINLRVNKDFAGFGVNIINGASVKTTSESAQINVDTNRNLLNAGKISSSATGAVVTLNAGTISSTSVDGIDLVDSGSLLATATAGELLINNAKIVGDIFARAVGDIGITNVGAVTLSASTTNNGDISVSNSGGTLSLGTVNAQSGIAAHGTGDVTLTGTSSVGGGVVLRSGVNVTGRNITLSGTSTDATGLGFQGEDGVFNATGSLSLTGIATGSGDGFYNFRGLMTAATGIAITGTSGSGKGVGLDATAQVTNGSSGDIVITGSSSTDAISLRGMSISNGGGDITLMANQGQIFSDTGNPAWGLGASLPNTITQDGTGIVSLVAGALAADSGAIDGTALTITQNSNAGVLVRTAGTGNITTPKIINVGTGDVVVAAGSSRAAGTGAGGQVLTVAGNTITQDRTGKTYIYTGQASGTGQLSHLSGSFASLYYQGTTNTLNAQFNTAFNGKISGGADAQVLFREVEAPKFDLTLNDINKVYGDADPANQANQANQAALIAALQSAYNNASGLTTLSTTAGVDGGNLFQVAAADVISALVGTSREAGENVGAYAYSGVVSTFNTNPFVQPKLIITPAPLTATVNNSAVFVTQLPNSAPIMGVTYAGLKNNENASQVLNTSSIARTYTGASGPLGVGSYEGVFGLSGALVGGNYEITQVMAGDLNVFPADKLLITIGTQTADYGTQSATNLGVAGLGTVTAVYCLDGTNCNGSIVALTTSRLSDTRWKAEDNTGSFVVFDTSLLSPSFSTGGFVNVGSYTFDASQITPESLFANGVKTFTGRATNGGVLTVNAVPMTAVAMNVDRTQTGTQLTQAVDLQGLFAGDNVIVGGAASGTATGLYTSALMVDPANPGADRNNYQITFVNASMRIVPPTVEPNEGSTNQGNSQSQTEAQAQLSAQSQANNLVNSTDQTDQSSVSILSVDNPFQPGGFDLAGLGNQNCDIGEISNCRCEEAVNDDGTKIEGLQICFEEPEPSRAIAKSI